MKKFIAIALICFMSAFVFVGCGQDALSTTATETETASESTEDDTTTDEETTDIKYDNTLSGLAEYLNSKGYIESLDSPTVMSAELIGADKGYRYTSGTARIELYRYRPNKLDNTGKKVIESVKENGTFELYGNTFNAWLTDDGKFLMIYSDTAIGEDDTTSDAYKTRQKAVKAFKNFSGK